MRRSRWRLEAEKTVFFEKKEPENFCRFGCGLSKKAPAQDSKVFCFFF
jgi:hypothetical protein